MQIFESYEASDTCKVGSRVEELFIKEVGHCLSNGRNHKDCCAFKGKLFYYCKIFFNLPLRFRFNTRSYFSTTRVFNFLTLCN